MIEGAAMDRMDGMDAMDPMEHDPLLSDADPTSSLTINLSRTAQAVFAAGTVDDTLQQVVDVATTTIEGCDFASIFLVTGGLVTTPVHTSPAVAAADALQQEANEGPCLDAIARRITVYVDDLAEDGRWPRFGPGATAAGMRSLLALPMSSDGTLGALNLYARYPRAFGVIDRGKGLILATLAGLALSSARVREDDERQAENLRSALVTREVIGQAQGILMERERITPDEAFDILRRASQHLNRKLRDVAQDLVDTGKRPQGASSLSSP